MRHRLTYSWQSCSFCWHIIEVLAHLGSASQKVGSWDTARVFLAQIPLSLPGFSWPMIEDHSQLRSSILSRMSWLDMYEANFDKLRVIMDVSFLPRHASQATNKPPKRMYSQYGVQFVYFSLLHSHHVFFDFELVDPVHTDLSRHFTFRCRRRIPLCTCEDMNLCFISMLKAAANMPWTLSAVSTVH